MYECPNGYGAIAKYWTDGLVQAMSHYSVSTTLNPKMFAVVLLANIQFQLVQIEGFSAHLMSYEQSILELEKAERAKMQAFEEKVRILTSYLTSHLTSYLTSYLTLFR